MARIGIGITTRNRNDVLKECLVHFRRNMPEDSILVVVDDASDIPVEKATYRFQENAGIAKAKNKCLELLDGCEHIFLFDDDIYPISARWHEPYISSAEGHLMYIFENFKARRIGDSSIEYRDRKITSYTHPRGCMIYIDKETLQKAGGMDEGYGIWGYEHVDWSNRIHNMGLTRFRFMDVTGSETLFRSLDEHQAVKRSFSVGEISVMADRNSRRYNRNIMSTQKYPYKPHSAILTCYLTHSPDPQRTEPWEADLSQIRVSDERLVVLHDCFDTEKPGFVRVEGGGNPYMRRWFLYRDYLEAHPEIESVFMVDATDVDVLNDPFPHIEKGMLYVGDENETLSNKWLSRTTKSKEMRMFFAENGDLILLNCGIVGGDRETVMIFLDVFCSMIEENGDEMTDMPIMNYLIYTNDISCEHGGKVNTVFKGYEKESGAWFRHK